MQQVLAKLRKNLGTEIWVTLTDYTGEQKIDIREYFRPDDGPDYQPTQKGISVPKNQHSELLELVASVEGDDSIGTAETLQLSNNVELRAGTRQYLNRTYKELRIYIYAQKNSEWKPTRRGVTFKPELATQLYEAVATLDSL